MGEANTKAWQEICNSPRVWPRKARAATHRMRVMGAQRGGVQDTCPFTAHACWPAAASHACRRQGRRALDGWTCERPALHRGTSLAAHQPANVTPSRTTLDMTAQDPLTPTMFMKYIPVKLRSGWRARPSLLLKSKVCMRAHTDAPPVLLWLRGPKGLSPGSCAWVHA